LRRARQHCVNEKNGRLRAPLTCCQQRAHQRIAGCSSASNTERRPTTAFSPSGFAGAATAPRPVAAGAGSVYSWREKGERNDQLRQQEQANSALVAAGGLPTDTSSIRDDIKLYRGLTIGLAVTAGLLALVGGGVTIAGLGQRKRAVAITMQAGGVGVQF